MDNDKQVAQGAAVTVDTPEFRAAVANYANANPVGKVGRPHPFEVAMSALIAHIDAHTAQAVADAYAKGRANGARDEAIQQKQEREDAAPQQHAQALDIGGAELVKIQHKFDVSPVGKDDIGGAEQGTIEHAQAALSNEQIGEAVQRGYAKVGERPMYDCDLKNVVKEVQAAIAAASQQSASAPAIAECEKCNGQGATHYPDGEWEGKCTACKGTGIIPAAAPAIQQEADDLTEEKWRVKCWESIRQHHMLPDGIEQRIKASVLAIQQEGAALDDDRSVRTESPPEFYKYNPSGLEGMGDRSMLWDYGQLVGWRFGMQQARAALAAPVQPTQGEALSQQAEDSRLLDWLEANCATLTRLHDNSGYILSVNGLAISTGKTSRAALRALNKQGRA